jgi:hypothetical protein
MGIAVAMRVVVVTDVAVAAGKDTVGVAVAAGPSSSLSATTGVAEEVSVGVDSASGVSVANSAGSKAGVLVGNCYIHGQNKGRRRRGPHSNNKQIAGITGYQDDNRQYDICGLGFHKQ